MLIFLFKASLVLFILLAFYKLVIEKESFFAANRIYLITCLIAAVTLPFIGLPHLIQHQGIVENVLPNQSPETTETTETTFSPPKPVPPPPPPSFQENAADQEGANFAENKSSKEGILEIRDKKTTASRKSSTFWLSMVYIFGASILLLNLLAQVVSTLLKVYKNDDKLEDEDNIIVNLKQPSEPCSFFKYIFIHPDSYDFDTYEQIVEHEKIHVRKRHTIDLLIAELAVVFFWFNPFVWIFRKEVEKNIEYQTDAIMTNGEPQRKEIYQLNLLRIATYNKPLAVTTNYNQSLVKQRILKMNTKRSNIYSYWKYTFMLPVLFATLLFINKPEEANATSPIDWTAIDEDPDINFDFAGDAEGEYDASTEFDIDESQVQFYANADSPIEALIESIHSDDMNSFLQFIDAGTSPKGQDEDGWSPLHEAAGHGRIEMAKILLEKGAEIDIQDNEGTTPLLAGLIDRKLESASYLLDEGANFEIKDNEGWTPLMAAIYANFNTIVEWMIDEGVDVNQTTNEGWSPLMQTAENDARAIASLLLDQGADIDARDEDGYTALHHAIHHGNIGIADYLLSRGADALITGDDGWNLLMEAIDHSHEELYPLLIRKGIDINATMDDGWTALMQAVKDADLGAVQFLVKRGAKINVVTEDGHTPVNIAIALHHDEIFQYLLSRGADVQFGHNKEVQVIEIAQSGEEVKIEMGGREVSVKVGSDANINPKCLALYVATQANEIEAVLGLIDDVDPDCVFDHNNDPRTAMVVAAQQGNLEIGKILVKAGADIEHHARGDATPLIAAARNGHYDFVQYLLEKGAKVNNAVQGDGNAIIAAVRGNHHKVAELLLEAGADPYQNVPGDEYAMYHARVGQDQRMINLLKKYADK